MAKALYPPQILIYKPLGFQETALNSPLFSASQILSTSIHQPLLRDRVEIQLREWISQGSFKIGDRLLPEKKLASQLDVNHQTLRLALQKLEDQGILERKRGSGTFIKKLLSQASEILVAVLIRNEGDVYSELASELSKACQHHALLPVFITPHAQESQQLLNSLLRLQQQGCAHLIMEWAAIESHYDALKVELKKFSHRVWLWEDGEARSGLSGHVVDLHHGDAARQLLKNLNNTSQKKIQSLAYVSYGSHNKTERQFRMIMDSKCEDIANQCRSLDMEPEVSYLALTKNPQERLENVKHFLQHQGPFGFLVDNDYRAIQLVQTLQQLGLERDQDYVLASYGNTPWAHSHQLDSLAYPIKTMAEKAVELLSQDQDEQRTQLQIKGELVLAKERQLL